MSGVDYKAIIFLLATQPRKGMQAVLDLRLSDSEILLFGSLVAVSTGIFGYASIFIAPAIEGAVVPSPLGYVFVGAISIVISAFVYFWAGRSVQGTGDFRSVALSMIVHQAFMNFLPLWAAIFSTFIPGLFGFALIIGFIYVLFLMAGFLAQAHNLRSIGTAAFLIAAVMFVITAIFVFLFALFGMAPA